MPDWIIASLGFWWTLAGLFLLYYAAVLVLLFGPVYLAVRKREKLNNVRNALGESPGEELCKAFQEEWEGVL